MLEHLTFTAFLALAALLFACLEVQIEGPAGWAASLPTWRIENRWTRTLLGGRPLTGYHVYIHLSVLALAHAPYGLALLRPSAAAEARILAFLILFWILEDFLWFVVNPAYGLRAFRRERIPWHAATWWWIMPRDYWIFAPLGIALYLAST